MRATLFFQTILWLLSEFIEGEVQRVCSHSFNILNDQGVKLDRHFHFWIPMHSIAKRSMEKFGEAQPLKL